MKAQFVKLNKVADVIGINRTTLIRRAKKQGYSVRKVKSKTGLENQIDIHTLPQKDQLLYNRNKAEALVESLPDPELENYLPAKPDPTHPLVQSARAGQYLPPKPLQEKALAKFETVRVYLRDMDAIPRGGKVAWRKTWQAAFEHAYPHLYKTLGPVKWKTLEGWKRTLEQNNNDFICLVDVRGSHLRGKCVLSDDQKKIVLRAALNPNRPKLAEAIRMAWAVMHAQGIPNGNSMATYRRYLNDWKSKNFHLWIFTREGATAWNDKCASYIERDYSLINVGDVIVADGHVLNFEIINPHTGKPTRMTLIVWYDMKSSYPLGWEIMPTENTQAINSALRRAILTLGKIPQVAYLDNGRAFKARFFTSGRFDESKISGLYERLGMKTIFAWPYHGQSKTVERFFGTFAELERWAPTYVGTSIEKKPPRMNRGERLHKKLYDTANPTITLQQAHRAIAAWFNEYTNRPQRGHLEGQCPAELFLPERGPGIEAADLTLLMMEQEIRTIYRNGIRLFRQSYNAPELYGRRRPVVVRYDLQDQSEILVYETDGTFICSAYPPPKIHPAATALGSENDQLKLAAEIAKKRSQEREAAGLTRDILENEVIPQQQRYLEQHGLTETGPKESRETIALRDSVIRADMPNEEIEKRINEGQARIKGEMARAFWRGIDEMNHAEQYERCLEGRAKGLLIPDERAKFMAWYETTDEYLGQKGSWEDAEVQYAIMYQTEEAKNA